MKIKSFGLAWVITTDMTKAKDFFTNKLGLSISQDSSEHGWIELKAEKGNFLLGVGADSGDDCGGPIKPGHNAVLTMNVDDIVAAKAELEKRGVATEGEIIEIPGHVKMLFFKDTDNNYYQLIQDLSGGCC